MSYFKLAIELGSEAMESPAHVAEALRELATALDRLPPSGPSSSGRVYDDDGNYVGQWTLRKPGSSEEDE